MVVLHEVLGFCGLFLISVVFGWVGNFAILRFWFWCGCCFDVNDFDLGGCLALLRRKFWCLLVWVVFFARMYVC